MVKKKDKGTKRFKGIVSRNAAKQSRGARYGHLTLPKGVNVFKEEPKSRVDIDILPYEVTSALHPDRDEEYGIAVEGSLWYKKPYWLHRGIGANSEDMVCPTSNKQKCPVCEYRAQMLKDGADWNDDSVKALKPSMRNLYVIIPKNSKNYSSDIHIWDISQFLFQSKLIEEIQENEEYETFPDLEDGYTLRIRFSEETLGSNKFADTSRIDFKARDEAYDETILEKVPKLDDILNVPTYKMAEALFFGGLSQDEIPSDDDDEDDDDENEEEEEDVEEDDDDDIEDDDDEEEEEEEDDEEEEEKPAPKKKPAPAKKETPAKKGKDSKCPHGHKFGADCEEYDECEDCAVWEACLDASEE